MSEALITESEPLTFTLPDGSLKLVRKGTTLQNVAESIDSSVAKNAVYAEIDGQYIDLIEAVQKSGTLNIITLFDEEALDPCTLEQLEGECKSILHLVLDIYKQFGFEEVEIKLSTRPEKRMGSDTDWDRLENALSASLEAQGLQWSVNPGEGAFYGPKKQHRYAEQVLKALRRKGLRCETDLRNEKIGYKIREQTLARIPFLLIIGDAEENAARVTVRDRTGKCMGTLLLNEAADCIEMCCRPPEVRLD